MSAEAEHRLALSFECEEMLAQATTLAWGPNRHLVLLVAEALNHVDRKAAWLDGDDVIAARDDVRIAVKLALDMAFDPNHAPIPKGEDGVPCQMRDFFYALGKPNSLWADIKSDQCGPLAENLKQYAERIDKALAEAQPVNSNARWDEPFLSFDTARTETPNEHQLRRDRLLEKARKARRAAKRTK
jgi:hypothetical protein